MTGGAIRMCFFWASMIMCCLRREARALFSPTATGLSFSAQSLRLAPFGMEQDVDMELMHLYAALGQAERRLYVSWAAADAGGTELRPAFAVGRIRGTVSGS